MTKEPIIVEYNYKKIVVPEEKTNTVNNITKSENTIVTNNTINTTNTTNTINTIDTTNTPSVLKADDTESETEVADTTNTIVSESKSNIYTGDKDNIEFYIIIIGVSIIYLSIILLIVDKKTLKK